MSDRSRIAPVVPTPETNFADLLGGKAQTGFYSSMGSPHTTKIMHGLEVTKKIRLTPGIKGH
jgi:hypothetical protein